uniref:HORMA domain-containing protein n=1 Tax=Eptatretus burgeri TaxID=7764 RepID=A0A8C4WVS2_EPTBU
MLCMCLCAVVAGCICEFLEVAFHYILYVRQIYPAGAFSRRLKYNVPVMVCLHPELCHYVEDVLEGVKPLLEQVSLSLCGDSCGVVIYKCKSFKPEISLRSWCLSSDQRGSD